METRTFDDDALAEARTAVRDRFRAAEESSYADYTPGEHCRWCPHRSLPCSADVEGDD